MEIRETAEECVKIADAQCPATGLLIRAAMEKEADAEAKP